MRILVTGCEGQVARSLAERAGGHELVFAGRPELELADPVSIARTVAGVRPELIVSAAAYTAVDKAEDEPDLAFAVNGVAPGVIGAAAAKIGSPVLHLSTDYVFDGTGDRAWTEADPTGPIGVYGRSKLAGEQALAASKADHVVIRTAWVYSPFGANFVKTMLRLGADREELNVVADQFGNPTSALDIADALLAVIDRWRDDPTHGRNATYHFAGTGTTNWADFARAIFSGSAERGGPACRVNSIASAEYPTKAARPANSRLDCSLFARTFDCRAPAWQVSLGKTLNRLLGKPTSTRTRSE